MSYADPEMAVASAFLMAVGKVLMIAEAQNVAAIASYNAVLARLGSAIRYPGARFSSSEKIDMTGATGLLAGLTRFSVAKYNTLAGGRSLIGAANGPVVMTERPGAPPPVPLPAGLVQLAGALATLAVAGAASAGRGRGTGCATGRVPLAPHVGSAAAQHTGPTRGLAR